MVRKSDLAGESFQLPADPAAAGMARRLVVEACHGLDDEQRQAVELLTSELVANAVRHPRRCQDSPWAKIVELTIHRTAQVLRVEVGDPDPRPLTPVRRPRAPRESGWGLHLLSELSTNWGSHEVETGEGKVVWFEMRINPGKRAPV